ncbi:hypothetical protein KL922_001279 [Ogataea haglerorum]|nr:hypothetical protein KL922_001279 [Ogataea haglerorum]
MIPRGEKLVSGVDFTSGPFSQDSDASGVRVELRFQRMASVCNVISRIETHWQHVAYGGQHPDPSTSLTFSWVNSARGALWGNRV